MLARIFLGLCALLFCIFAYSAFQDVSALTNSFGVDISGPHGHSESMGVYFGIPLVAAVFCLFSIFKSQLTRPTLLFIFIYFDGYFLGRMTSMLMGYETQDNMAYFLAFEAIFAIIALLLFIKHKG